MSSPSLRDSDGTDSDSRELTSGLDDSTDDSGSGNSEEEEEAVRISNDFDPGVEAIYHRNRHRNTKTDTDDIHQNDDGQTNMSSLPLQGAVALTQGEMPELSLAIVKAVTQDDREQRVTNIVINNPEFHLTKKTEVANLKAHNVAIGGQQVIQPSTSSVGPQSEQNKQSSQTEIPKDPQIQRIKEATVADIHMWTSGMIKTQFVDDIMKRIDAGQNWITVTGNGGDGKTTVAYMVLEEMRKQEKEVFRVKTVDDYYTITKNTDRCVIMLNDVIGAFALDTGAFSTWKPIIFDVMEKMSKAEESEQPCGLICVFVQRSNILKEVECSLEKHKLSITGEKAVSDLSRLPDNEQTLILDYHLNQKNISDVSGEEKGKVVGRSLPYGFPHCCKLFAELKSKGKKVEIDSFFSSPLDILDATTDAHLENENLKNLFKILLQKDGRLDTGTIEDDDKRSSFLKVSSPLTGSYLSNTQGIITFAHPSIYESVVNCIGKRDVVFALKYLSDSLLMEKMRFAEPPVHDVNVSRSDFTVPPTPENIQRLCERFTPSVLNRNFGVLGSRFFQNENFCRSFFSAIIMTNSFWNNLTCQCWKQTGRMPVNEKDETGSTMLIKVLEYGNTTAARVLIEHGANVKKTNLEKMTGFHYLCLRGDVDASFVELMIQHGADVNKADLDGWTALHYLCTRDNVDAGVVELMIRHGADVNKADDFGKTVLHRLCEKDNVDAGDVELMIRHGADVNKTDRSGKTVLHRLCEKDNVDAGDVELMIRHGADVNKADDFGKTVLHRLCEKDNVDAGDVELMIRHGADVNKTDRSGKTVLHRLCEKDNVDAGDVELMIRHGADVKKTDRSGKTVLHRLCEKDNVDAGDVELMIRHGADVNKADDFGKTVLHRLCEKDNVDAGDVELMIRHGADVNKADDFGKTVLHRLCEKDNVDAGDVELMIRHGADVNKADRSGMTVLHYLCEKDNVDAGVVELMIRHGADVNKADWYGKTVLHRLCEKDNVDAGVVELMIRHGADVNKAGLLGMTVLHCLCEKDNVDAGVVELMIRHGADVNKADLGGRTALHYLRKKDNVEVGVVELMIQHGADVNKTDLDGRTALHYLRKRGNVYDIVAELMKRYETH